MSGFNLDDYVTVAERVGQFYSQFPEGSLQAEVVQMSEKLVVVRAYAYRNPEDPRPGIAHSSLNIPGTTPYTKGSELENAETSAVGRAIALLGFGVKKSLASRNELEAKGAQREEPHEGSLVGVAKVGERTTSDGQLRETPTGHRLGFRLESREGDKGGILVEANDGIAVALAETRDKWFNQPVTAWGLIEQREFVPKGRTKPVVYQALVLSKIQTPNGTIPVPEGGPGEPPQAGAEAAGVTESAPDEAQALPVPPDAAGASSSEPAALSPGSAPDDQCDSASPYGDNLQCELLAGHKGPHKVLSLAFPETWTDR